MAARKKKPRSITPQYAKASANKRRGGGNSPKLVLRLITLVMFLVVVGAIITGLLFGFKWIGRQLFSENDSFKITELIISSNGSMEEYLIREYTGREDEGIPPLAKGQNLFARSFDDIKSTLLDSPLIESVHIERKLPGKLTIKITERSAVARIIGAQNTKFPFVVDRFGQVLSYKLKYKKLPLIKGIKEELVIGQPAKNPDVETALKIVMLVDSRNELRRHIKIDSLDVKYADFIDMRINDGTRVRMPRYALEKKLGTLATTVEIGRTRGERYREIDMTLDSLSVPTVPY